MKSKFSHFKKIIKNLMLLAVSTVIGFAIICFTGEAALRCGVSSWRSEIDELRDFRYEKYASTYDALHERYTYPDISKGDNTFRIIALGDSFTWGDKISKDKDVWPSVLQDRLNSRHGFDRKIEVMNFGKCGFNTINEYELLEEYGWSFKPDLIVLEFTLNDALPGWKDFKNQGEDKFFKTNDLIRYAPLHIFLNEHSYFYSFLNDRFISLQMLVKYKDGHRALYKEEMEGWRKCQIALLAMARSAASKKVKVVFVIFPIFEKGAATRDTYRYADIHDRLKFIGGKLGFYTVDLLDVFMAQGKELSYWRAMRLDGHPGVEAHRLAALAVEDTIIKNDLIPGFKK